jgi:hypothetical protein
MVTTHRENVLLIALLEQIKVVVGAERTRLVTWYCDVYLEFAEVAAQTAAAHNDAMLALVTGKPPSSVDAKKALTYATEDAKVVKEAWLAHAGPANTRG